MASRHNSLSPSDADIGRLIRALDENRPTEQDQCTTVMFSGKGIVAVTSSKKDGTIIGIYATCCQHDKDFCAVSAVVTYRQDLKIQVSLMNGLPDGMTYVKVMSLLLDKTKEWINLFLVTHKGGVHDQHVPFIDPNLAKTAEILKESFADWHFEISTIVPDVKALQLEFRKLAMSCCRGAQQKFTPYDTSNLKFVPHPLCSALASGAPASNTLANSTSTSSTSASTPTSSTSASTSASGTSANSSAGTYASRVSTPSSHSATSVASTPQQLVGNSTIQTIQINNSEAAAAVHAGFVDAEIVSLKRDNQQTLESLNKSQKDLVEIRASRDELAGELSALRAKYNNEIKELNSELAAAHALAKELRKKLDNAYEKLFATSDNLQHHLMSMFYGAQQQASGQQFIPDPNAPPYAGQASGTQPATNA